MYGIKYRMPKLVGHGSCVFIRNALSELRYSSTHPRANQTVCRAERSSLPFASHSYTVYLDGLQQPQLQLARPAKLLAHNGAQEFDCVLRCGNGRTSGPSTTRDPQDGRGLAASNTPACHKSTCTRFVQSARIIPAWGATLDIRGTSLRRR